jgi:hypothetical protein
MGLLLETRDTERELREKKEKGKKRREKYKGRTKIEGERENIYMCVYRENKNEKRMRGRERKK